MNARKTRIMYVEDKSGGLNGPARIGRVMMSQSGQSIHYDGRTFQRLGGSGGLKSNYFDVATGEEYWISGPRRDGADRLYPSSARPIEVDADVRDEYWRDVRGLPVPK
ncbi:hypothetical protein [Sphingomonas sp. 37zxx]|uniref:hypothetical protein n=1 Tax=Sphingomonas sp. 37zxx TaxID=1550073 RepID=UPI00053BDCC8|nr:hypothetical protein [Sphingomonas sp. 37zxx]